MVNVKELMIGDYVDVDEVDSKPVIGIVKEIFTDPTGYLIVIEKGEDIDCFCEDEILPIVLSKDFFLKNGFKELCRTEYSTRLYNSDLYLRVKITSENRFTCNNIGVNYVHEFQHYLRLVNLFDYANNLKI
jgi:hypothetical protein